MALIKQPAFGGRIWLHMFELESSPMVIEFMVIPADSLFRTADVVIRGEAASWAN